MPKFILPEISKLIGQKKWDDLESALCSQFDDETSEQKLERLIYLAMVYRSNGKLHQARSTMRDAILHLENNQFSSTDPLIQKTVHELEASGLLQEAYQIASRFEISEAGSDPRDIMLKRLAYANSNLAKYPSSSPHIISLGQNCLPSAVTGRWGLGPLVVDGPFTRGVVRGNGAAIAIEDDFRQFCDENAYRIGNSAAGLTTATLVNYKMLFNHEVGDSWIDSGLVKMQQFYSRRVENFKKALEAKNLLFVFTRISSAQLNRLWNVIAELAPAAEKRLLVFDFISGRNDEELNAVDFDRVRILPTAYPYAQNEVVWWRAEYFNTETGFTFERSIADAITEELGKFAA